MQRDQGMSVMGMLLTFIGIFYLLSNYGFLQGDEFLVFVGVGLIGAYLVAGRPLRLLVPGAVLLAFGAFSALETGRFGFRPGPGWFFMIMGFSFALVFVIDSLGRSRATIWPLYPAAALLVMGFGLMASDVIPRWVWHYAASLWPAILVVVGLLLVFRPRQG